jgi:hypothetical protein
MLLNDGEKQMCLSFHDDHLCALIYKPKFCQGFQLMQLLLLLRLDACD